MNNLNEIISAISLLVVFSTLLFTYFVKEADEFILFDLSKIDTNQRKLKTHKGKLLNFILWKWLSPVVLLNVIFSIIVFPLTLKIFKSTSFSFFNHDPIKTLFVLISIYILIFTFLTIYKLFQLIVCIRKCN